MIYAIAHTRDDLGRRTYESASRWISPNDEPPSWPCARVLATRAASRIYPTRLLDRSATRRPCAHLSRAPTWPLRLRFASITSPRPAARCSRAWASLIRLRRFAATRTTSTTCWTRPAPRRFRPVGRRGRGLGIWIPENVPDVLEHAHRACTRSVINHLDRTSNDGQCFANADAQMTARQPGHLRRRRF